MVLTTERFAALSRQVADSFGLPETRIVVVPHPLGGTDTATVEAWALAAVEPTLRALTGRRG